MTPRILPLAPGPAPALRAAAGHSPYLARLARQHPDIVETLDGDGDIRAAFDAALAPLRGEPLPFGTAGVVLRTVKARAHLLIAAADLCGTWQLDEVTAAMSELADASIGIALAAAWERAIDAGRVTPAPLAESGLFVLAMGKLGAGELNYSSDIDLIVMFDPERFPTPNKWPVRQVADITADMVRLLHDITENGYTFRVDLRLRPDPGSTAIAVSVDYALTYYESLGQNWERMAYIKARPCAGDLRAADDFLQQIAPFVWRRALDYWTIADIHAIVGQIHASGKHHELTDPAFDVKLGRGGIREIEFIAQTQQLILGGRNQHLRAPRTVDSLSALAEHGTMPSDKTNDLIASYRYLRMLEHRIQMIGDEQTHLLSAHNEPRHRVQALCGVDGDALDTDIAAVRQIVHRTYSELFEDKEIDPEQIGNLVFTGVENDPGTVDNLRRMGFSDPDTVIATLRRWHRGGLPATGSQRGRALLTRLTPPLLYAMSRTGNADAAFARFHKFMSGLRAGVQVFSLLLAQPALRDDLAAAMVIAPKLAEDLARRPAILDAMLDPGFLGPLGAGNLASLREATEDGDFENACNAARRFHREESFRIAYSLIRRQVDVTQAGTAYSDLASACVRVLAELALAETQSRYGRWNAQWAVCGLGRLGGRDMTASSDLDLMLIYQPDGEGGENSAARFVQRLISALSAPTEEGAIYEVDMRLRPSGRAGPVAVKLSAFERYYREKAWTWEFMALTRMRPVAGDPEFSETVASTTRDLISAFGRDSLDADVLDMRRRLARERPPLSRWDVKLAPGGLFDIDFVVQHAMLTAARERPSRIHPGLPEAIAALVEADVLTGEDAAILLPAYRLQTNILHCLSVASSDGFDPSQAPRSLNDWLAECCGAQDATALENALISQQRAVADLRTKKIGSI